MTLPSAFLKFQSRPNETSLSSGWLAKIGAPEASRCASPVFPAPLVLPVRADGTRYQRYSDALGDLAAPAIFANRVTYRLTDRGHALIPALDLIARWAHDNLPPDKC